MSLEQFLLENSKQEAKTAKNNLYILYGHMIKYANQPYNQSASWLGDIQQSYNKIAKILRKNTTARNMITKEDIDEQYQKAIEDIVIPDTDMQPNQFPNTIPKEWDLDIMMQNNKFIKDFIKSKAATDSAEKWIEDKIWKIY